MGRRFGAVFALGTSSFILQNFYDEHFAKNFMMQLVVPNLDQWWEHIQTAELVETFTWRRRGRRKSSRGDTSWRTFSTRPVSSGT